MLPWSEAILYYVAIWQVMMYHMLVVSYNFAEQSLIAILKHFCHLVVIREQSQNYRKFCKVWTCGS